LKSFTPLEDDTVRSGQNFNFDPASIEARTLSLDPGSNDLLILKMGGFERDDNLPDKLPIGEVGIRPSTAGFGLSMAVDGGESQFAYEADWNINLVG